MMPDKIYLREFPDGIARFWESKKKEDVVAAIPHEYIRKDTLIEWAKKELEKRRNAGNDYFLPAIVVLNDLIDKLNEL